MSASNSAILEGRISNINTINDDNVLKYEIRVDTLRPKKKDLDKYEKELIARGTTDYQKHDYINVVAYPSIDSDPWQNLTRGMLCRFECELRNPDNNPGQFVVEALSVCILQLGD